MTFQFHINAGSDTPIYRQITDQVRMGLAIGRLTVGDQLPSLRALAEALVINPNTVARAYTELTREGLIESRTGRGIFVSQKRRIFTREEGRRRLEPLLDSLIGQALAMDLGPEELRAAFEKKLSLWQNRRPT